MNEPTPPNTRTLTLLTITVILASGGVVILLRHGTVWVATALFLAAIVTSATARLLTQIPPRRRDE